MSSPGLQSGKRTGVTFEEVAAAAAALLANNEKATLRAVRSYLGTGSMGTITQHLTKWNQGEKAEPTVETLPNTIQNAILCEIGRATSAARFAAEEKLASVEVDRNLLAEENEKQAALLVELEKQLFELHELFQQQKGACEQLRADLEQAKESSSQERSIADVAQRTIAKYELQLEAMPKLEQGIKDLRIELAEVCKARTSAEKEAAVSAATLAGFEHRLAEAISREKLALTKMAQAEQEAHELSEKVHDLRYLLKDAEHRAITAATLSLKPDPKPTDEVKAVAEIQASS
jgi:colicin import membrane protein